MPSQFPTALQSDWCHAMKADSSDPVFAVRQNELSPEQVETALREIAQFTTSAARTRYGKFRAKGYFLN